MHTLSYTTLNPETVIKFYKNGIFPMGDQDNGNQVFWCNPLVRAIIPISKLHISRSLKRLCKKKLLNFQLIMILQQLLQTVLVEMRHG